MNHKRTAEFANYITTEQIKELETKGVQRSRISEWRRGDRIPKGLEITHLIEIGFKEDYLKNVLGEDLWERQKSVRVKRNDK